MSWSASPRPRYAPVLRKRALLAEVAALLVRLRGLLRLAYDRRLVDHGAFERLAGAVDEAGRLVGGWRQHLGDGG